MSRRTAFECKLVWLTGAWSQTRHIAVELDRLWRSFDGIDGVREDTVARMGGMLELKITFRGIDEGREDLVEKTRKTLQQARQLGRISE